jgi:hypothetical protein
MFARAGSGCSLAMGIITKTAVPALPDSILISPWNWRKRSRIPLIPTPERSD